MNDILIKAQKGFQEDFQKTKADIAIGGGCAGAGKTFISLAEPLRHIVYDPPVNNFGAVFFRRETPQIKTEGGLWDESCKMYPLFGGIPNYSELFWTFRANCKVKFSHLEHEKNKYGHQGAQYPLIIFDELCQFTKGQFFYLLSRNRSICGITPYIRATCNPDPDSFVADLISWWIDQETGFPIKERGGILRYFIRDNDNYIWGDSYEEVRDKAKYIFESDEFKNVNSEELIKSITFIPGNIFENKELLSRDPQYLSNLMALDEVEKTRLLKGNWKVKLDGLNLFNFFAVKNIFTNFPTETTPGYITCDAARFGDDFTVIFVWSGLKIIKTIILTKSDAYDIKNVIETEREKFNIPVSNVIIDADIDGVGQAAASLGGYIGFHGGLTPFIDPETKKRGLFKSLKTQLYYKLSELVNNNEIGAIIENDTCIIDGKYGIKIKTGNILTDIRELIKKDLSCIKRKDPDKEGKKQINSKEEQKVILNNRSPDFADSMMLRAYFYFKHQKISIQW